MIRRLQLRGISRTPSDRMTQDGGCAESLNVHLDDNEITPTLRPEVINSMTDDDGYEYFPPTDWQVAWECVYIHKTPYFTRAIIKYVESGEMHFGVWNGEDCDVFLSVSTSETFVRCISLGNTLGIVTDQSVHWNLMSNGEYTSIGTDIPFPAFTLTNYEVASSSTSGEEIIRDIQLSEAWSNVVESSSTMPSSLHEYVLNSLWTKIDEAVATNRRQGVYNYQQFAILAIKLFDETRIISTPVFISPGFEQPYKIDFTGVYSSGTQTWSGSATVKFKTAYKLFLQLNQSYQFFEDWKGVVDSVEVYVSPLVGLNIDRNQSSFTDIVASGTNLTANINLGDPSYSYLEQYLNASNFYRVFTMEVNDDNIDQLQTGMVLDTKNYMLTDDLVTKGYHLNSLSDNKHYGVIYTQSLLYNNKIVASGISEKVAFELASPIARHTYNTDIGDVWKPEYSINYQTPQNPLILEYRLTFHLKDSSGSDFSIKATHNGSEYFGFGYVTLAGDTCTTNAYSMIVCPDARAYSVDVEATIRPLNSPRGQVAPIGSVTLPMTEHPNLDCSYWYGGDGELLELCREGTISYIAGADTHVESLPNKIYVSEMDNPFIFPLASRLSTTSRVIGCAIATQALSTGQFGQFPVYAFTEDGIWAIEAGSDGTFLSTKPLSRDVCTNERSITTIDNAVVFVTSKTVMMISGSQVVDLSPDMHGKHFTIDSTSREYALINGGQWSGLLAAVTDDTPFMDFMSDAMVAYDYKGDRLVFFNANEQYQYVYMLKTQTWHKMYVDGQGTIAPLHILNNYPDTYVNVRTSGSVTKNYIWNLSPILNVSSTEDLKGIIVTRPFDLEETDIRKTIKKIKSRGQFNRGDIKYILLGSMDGIHWGVLPSLRGGSYKLFRLIILSSLTPVERLSWVDIEYETRLTNRLR